MITRHHVNLIILSLISGIIALSSCREKDSSKPAINNLISCLPKTQASRLQRLAEHFSHLSGKQRLRMQQRLDQSLENELLPAKSKISKLSNYFRDVTDQNQHPLDGSGVSTRSVDDDIQIVGIEVGRLENVSIEIIEPFWSGYALPDVLFVKNFPLFRGDQSLVASLLDSGSPLSEKNLKSIKSLFAEGLSLKKLQGTDYFDNADAFLHSLDSSRSQLLSSSTNFEVARRFGIVPGAKWSAIIEFRGYGVDINKAAYYFSQFDFLNVGTSIYNTELEIAVSRSVPPTKIKGVWLISAAGETIFIKNSNYNTF